MPKQKWNFNSVYISERLQECLRPIARCALTAVVAPMGYGKTTAVNWFLRTREKAEQPRLIRVSVYSDNLAIFWKSVQDAFAHAQLPFLLDYACPADDAGGSLLADELCHKLAGRTPCYLFIDDFHLLTDRRAVTFLCMLANRLPENVHLIVASRDRFLSAAELMRLGGRVYQLGTEQLRLNHTELAVYARRCGTALSDEQIERLLYSSEGWFSAVYLNLRTMAERGALPDRSSDIYAMFTAAMIDPLPPAQQEFLAVLGLADEFTLEMAAFVTENSRAGQLLAALSEQNAFVSRLPDGARFRFHHMMKACAEDVFHRMNPAHQAAYHSRYGAWYEAHGQYLHAMSSYRKSGDAGAVLRVVEQDAGQLLASLQPAVVLEFLDGCPEAVLKAHPQALLVLMRRMFTWRQIPRMMALKTLLLAAIEEQPDMPARERGNLLGECDLILSFLFYNDISAMSRLHRSASRQMARPAISIRSSGGWSFGSPSVLMMFHREPGALARELAEMDECMPCYYRVTNGHGQGAETLMRAEAAFAQGRFSDAQIELERAYAQIAGNGQENIALCCDFLANRLSLCTAAAPRCSPQQRYDLLLARHGAAWVPLWSAACAYTAALLGREDRIPALFAEHRLSSVSFLAPGRPMMEMIENQVYLAQGAWARVVGRSEGLLALCDELHYALVALHIRLQTAAAYEMLGKRAQAQAFLRCALESAVPDGLFLPICENGRYLEPLLEDALEGLPEAFSARLRTLCRAYAQQLARLRARESRPAALAALTGREHEIVLLMQKRLTNREIAERLYLSEGSVKQYINQIYAKLHIEGDTRTKRRQLFAAMEQDTEVPAHT